VFRTATNIIEGASVSVFPEHILYCKMRPSHHRITYQSFCAYDAVSAQQTEHILSLELFESSRPENP
jgi:hypothetical protein